MTSRRWVVVAIGTAAVVLILGRALSGLYVEYQWYAAMDAEAIWRARFANLLLLRGLSGIVGTLFVIYVKARSPRFSRKAGRRG